MSRRWLVLRLEAPLMAFGGVAIDQFGPTREFPSASMLTGLFANALGWHWSDRVAHQSLQDRMLFGARSEATPNVLTDTQNAQLSKSDKAWTTSGTPAGRAGASYGAPHRRSREYLTDHATTVVLRLEPGDGEPTLSQLAHALEHPVRPLYIGRKPCLPSCRLMHGWVSAENAYRALSALPGSGSYRALWPAGEGPNSGADVVRILDRPDLRNWHTGWHSGSRNVVEGQIGGASDE